ncbi:ABC transporter permease [Fulvivirgaceae bacterium BMA10]|uniref:ABC transporter permease n=1 Tax=Splendidivirga corallicola TaxID=3051826 RepID=A0ABT8KN76_9BACT|nr:ABC transporter permease [Fulvivirgaceae bacterium BMA10]
MKPQKNIPPKSADQFLTWFCKGELLEEIQGDLHEYHEELTERPKWKRNFLYWFHVFNFLRPFAIKKSRSINSNFSIMFRHALLISFRSFKRYTSSFFINIIGLSTALTCATLIYLWVNDELLMDKFHENGDNIFHVMEAMEFPSGTVVGGNSSGIIAPLLSEEMPEVEHAVQVARHLDNTTLSFDDKTIKADGHYVSKDFFGMFSFPLIEGSKNNIWDNPDAIVISETLANNLFGSTYGSIGQNINFRNEKHYTVSGVFRDVPNHSSEKFDFLLSFEGHTASQAYLLKWSSQSVAVYLSLYPDADVQAFNEKIHDFIGKHSERHSYRIPFLVKYSDEYLYGEYEGGVQSGGRITYVKLFSIIGIFILVIACINFMNLSTARASRRLKEIGVKKVVGARKATLTFQYLMEAVVIAFLALLLALIFVFILLPEFNAITGKQLGISFNLDLMLTLFGITLLTGLMSGSYPALYLSGFKPIAILKGKLNTSVGEIWTRKGLVIIQYTVSVILIVSVLVVYNQIDFIQNKDLGYNKDQIIHFDVEGKMEQAEHMDTFLDQMRNIPGVVMASSTRTKLTGDNWGVGGIEWEGKSADDAIYFQHMIAYYDLIEVLGIELANGRSFSRDFSAENTKVIFNEAAIAHMGLENPVGKIIRFRGQNKEIIGVVKDFHFDSFHESVKPMMINFMPNVLSQFMVKIEADRGKETLKSLEKLYLNSNPGFLFDYKFLDNDFQELYASEQRVSILSNYFAGVAILISCLGLFGLAAFTAERRIKEIGIRKILGAGMFGIVRMLSADFTKMVMVAIIIASPVSYLLAKEWLNSFAYRIDLEWWFFVGSGVITLLIAWLAVGWQTIKAAQQNPVNNLRYE